MLSTMRKNAQSWMIKILFGIIVIVFVFFYGFTGLRKKRETILASVGDRRITFVDYQRAYSNLLQFYRNIYRDQFSDEMIKQMGLREKALENLIERELLLQEAERLHINASPEEIRQYIVQNKAFQKDGVFSKDTYEAALKYYGISIEDFEETQKKELIIHKLQDMLKSTIKVSEGELWDRYVLDNEKVSITYLSISPESIKTKPEVTTEEIKQYFEKNAEQFRIPDKVKVKYIEFIPKDFEDKVMLDPKEVESYYQMDLDRFSEPEKVKASHILFKVPEKISPEKLNSIRQRAEKILEKAKKGEDFAKLAARYSQDTSTAKKGGDLGYFKKGDMVKPFEEAAFSMKKGQISDLVRTKYGFHIIRLEDVQEAHIKPFEEVRPVLEKELKAEEAQKLAKKEANRAYNRLFKSRDIDQYAQKNKLKLLETDYFSYGKGPEDRPDRELFSEAAFPLSPGELSHVFTLDQKYVLLKLEDKQASHIPKLEQVQDTIRKILEKQKRKEIAQQKAEKILAQLKAGEPLSRLAKKHGLEVKTSPAFSRRGDYLPGIGKSKELKEACFSLSKENPYPDSIFATDRGYFVVQFKDKQLPTKEEFEKKRGTLTTQLIEIKSRELFNQYLENLKVKIAIKVNRKLLTG